MATFLFATPTCMQKKSVRWIRIIRLSLSAQSVHKHSAAEWWPSNVVLWKCGSKRQSPREKLQSNLPHKFGFFMEKKKVNFQPWVASKHTSKQGHKPPVRTLTRPLSTKLLYLYMASTMAEFYSRSSNACYILPQKCIRNYLDRRHKIPHFPGGACPQTLVGMLRTLYYVAPASHMPAVVQLDHFKSGGYGPAEGL